MSTVTQLFAEPINPAAPQGNYTIKLKLSKALDIPPAKLTITLEDSTISTIDLNKFSSDSTHTKYLTHSVSTDSGGSAIITLEGTPLNDIENKVVASVSYTSSTNQVNVEGAPNKICIKKPNDPMSCNNCMMNSYCGENCNYMCFTDKQEEGLKCYNNTDRGTRNWLTKETNLNISSSSSITMDPVTFDISINKICGFFLHPDRINGGSDTISCDVESVPGSPNGQDTDTKTTLNFSNIVYTDNQPSYAVTNPADGSISNTRVVTVIVAKVPPGFEQLQDFYKDIFRTYKVHHDNLNLDDDMKLDVDFFNIRHLHPDTIARSMFTLIKNLYDVSTFNTRNLYGDKRSTDQEIDKLKTEIDKKRLVINDLKSLNSTNKREIEINMYKTKKMRNTNKVLMIVMLVVGCLVLFPILSAAKVLPMMAATIIWAIGLIAVLGYMSYKLYFTDMNRDEIVYTKYNFVKPSEREVALSRAKAQLSDSDKARCQAFAELEEELDIPNVNIDISDYLSNRRTAPSGCNRFEDTSS